MKTVDFLQYAVAVIVTGMAGIVVYSFMRAPDVRALPVLSSGLEQEIYRARQESNLRLAQKAATIHYNFWRSPRLVDVDPTSGPVTVANIKGVDAPTDRVYKYGETCELNHSGKVHFYLYAMAGEKYIISYSGRSEPGKCPDGTLFFAVDK